MKAFLTQKEAEIRFETIQPPVKYTTYLNLELGESFTGTSRICFRLKKNESTFLDYTGRAVNSLIINGKEVEVTPELWKNGKLDLLVEHLRMNVDNEVIVSFSGLYSKSGFGLHTFTDTDKRQYLYTQAEPHWNNQIYPIFDQPDLKACNNFIIQAPADWKVISNTEKEQEIFPHEVSKLGDSEAFRFLPISVLDGFVDSLQTARVHVFKESKMISTYLFGFAAGPFAKFDYDGFDGPSVPMSIYCRDSLKDYMQTQINDVFIFSKRGIEIYERFFQTPYQYIKLDLVFCPQFAIGGMEYPGIMTLSDNYIYRQKPSINNISGRAKCILHELSHMWFGDYLTMKWWNDLWLKESFADFTCYFAMHWMQPVLPLKLVDAMGLFQDRKAIGYKADQELSTHAIASEVVSTEKASSIFDGVTYAKGASVLKQLYFIIGHEQFSENIRLLFKQFGGQNTTTQDFLNIMSRQDNFQKSEVKLNIEVWFRDWIETAGLNVLSSDFNPETKGKCILKIFQKPALKEFPILRSHKIKIGFYNNGGQVSQTINVQVNKASVTEILYVNNDYEAILLNYEDWGFVKIQLDPFSQSFFKTNLKNMTDVLSIMLIIQSQVEMVRDGDLKATAFVEMLLDGFLESISDNALIFEQSLNHAFNFLLGFVPRSIQNEWFAKVFQKIYQLIENESNANQIRILKMNLIRMCRGEEALLILKEIVQGTNPVAKKIQFSNAEKWLCFGRFTFSSKITAEEKQSMIDALSKIDKSDVARYALLKIEAFEANESKIEEIWNRMASKNRKDSAAEMEAIIICLSINIRRKGLSTKYIDRYFEDVYQLILYDDQTKAGKFFEAALPDNGDHDMIIKRYNELYGKLTSHQENFKTKILQKINLYQRKKNAFSLYKNDLANQTPKTEV